ncbi:hypothetical protein [Streptomyces melanogenes]|nr:hypothetical protein [Streptomyces melanogenes]
MSIVIALRGLAADAIRADGESPAPRFTAKGSGRLHRGAIQ